MKAPSTVEMALIIEAANEPGWMALWERVHRRWFPDEGVPVKELDDLSLRCLVARMAADSSKENESTIVRSSAAILFGEFGHRHLDFGHATLSTDYGGSGNFDQTVDRGGLQPHERKRVERLEAVWTLAKRGLWSAGSAADSGPAGAVTEPRRRNRTPHTAK
ncbi:hypothetical protein I6G59_12350 [Brevibacterium casei]|uniref:Uncharacterized protein n=1 Tax=Brevibacterium casei TaxID=33889 RepID=A0A7T2WN75_9MICO|nr:hypothetical protein I6G59_12350 [Brevibacterium casei]